MANGPEKTPDAPGSPARPLTRRDVLGTGLLVATGAVGAALPVVRYLSPTATGAGAGPTTLSADRVQVWEAERLLVAGRPAFVVRTPERVYAVSGVCTHLGCIVKWQRSRRIFFCPCHGARFGPDGSLLGGPAPRPLPRLEVAEERGKLIVRPA